MKKKPTISKLKKKLEKLVKDFVKRRDEYICQRCRKYVTGYGCHASHVIPVSAGNQFRFDPLNLKALCYNCHIHWWHKNPVEAGTWFKKAFPKRHEYLFGQPRVSRKFTIDELQELISYYSKITKDDLKNM